MYVEDEIIHVSCREVVDRSSYLIDMEKGPKGLLGGILCREMPNGNLQLSNRTSLLSLSPRDGSSALVPPSS